MTQLVATAAPPPADPSDRPCTAGAPPADPPPALSKLDVIRAVIRRCGPHVIEATAIPAVLFYGCLIAAGLQVAYGAAVLWTYSAVCHRLMRRLPVPPILWLGAIGITVRTLAAVVSHSSFVYFFQPIVATVAMGCVFLMSVVVGRPLIGVLAGEFWPIPPDVASRPGVLRLFRRLTFLWAAVNMATAAVTMTLLMSLPVGAFVALKQVSGLAITAAAVFVTVSLSLDTARREGLATTPSARRLVPALADSVSRPTP